MEFELGKAILAGLGGTVIMTAVMYMGALMNMKMDMPMMLGTMFLRKGAAAWALGLMLHLMMGAAFFVVYAALFNALSIESGVVGVSVLFGLVHGVMAGAAMGMMPAMHPRMATAGGIDMDENVPSPGFFAMSMGMMGPMALLALHALFGLAGGLIYNS